MLLKKRVYLFINIVFIIMSNKVMQTRIIELKPIENLMTVSKEDVLVLGENKQEEGKSNKSDSNSSSESGSPEPQKAFQLPPDVINLIGEDFVNDRDTFEDANLTKNWYIKQNLAELGCGVFNIIGLGIGFIAYDIANDLVNIYDPNQQASIGPGMQLSIKTYLYWLLLFSTICLCVLVVIRAYVKLRWFQMKKILPGDWRLLPHNLLWEMAGELLLSILIPNPFMMENTFVSNNSITNTQVVYKINDILVLLMLLRIIIIIRIFLSNTPYYSNSAFRVCRMHGCEPGYFYVMKCLMKKAPQQVIWVAMAIVITIFGYAIKVIETPLINALIAINPDDTSNDLSSYLNSVWCMIVTLTTVGYGDYFPRTLPGRAIIFVICIFGATSVSMMVFSLQTVLSLNNPENRAQNVIDRLLVRKKMRNEAACVITYLARIRFFSKRAMKYSKDTINSVIVKMKIHMIRFRALRVKLRSLQDNTSIQDEISRYFLFLKDDFVVLEERIDFLANFHDMIRRYLEEKTLIQRTPFKKPLEKSATLTNKDIRSFRKRISANLGHIDEKKLNLTPSLKSMGENSSLLSNYLRKQRLQEYQSNTRFYQENPLKSNKRKIEDLGGDFMTSSGAMKRLEKIHEEESEH